MKVLMAYFSYTSTVAQVSLILDGCLKAEGGDTTRCRILPKRAHGYRGWLLRSFIPRWRVPIRPVRTDLDGFDLVFLGFPKWTFACPPVNEYLKVIRGAEGKPFALFMCHRGFRQQPYLARMVRDVTRKGAAVVAAVDLRRRCVQQGRAEESIRSFGREALEAARRLKLERKDG